MTNSIFPCFWLDGQAKEAAIFYCSIFPNSKIIDESPMVVNFELNGSRFMALNGGDNFTFNEAVSFVVMCKDQKEIDYFWDNLIADGGTEGNCGWCKDKYGLSWQVVPTALNELLKNPEKVKRIMPIFRSIKKFDIKQLENA